MMLAKYVVALICLGTFSLASINDEPFNYDENGDDWTEPECRKGVRQSPVDFPFAKLKMKNQNTPKDKTLTRQLSARNQPISTFDWNREEVFDTLRLLSFDLDYDEFANVTVQNMSATIRMVIDQINGYFIVYEDDRSTEVFKPL